MNIVMVGTPVSDTNVLTVELGSQGHRVTTFSTGAAVLGLRMDTDLMLLELELPDMDGLEVCRRVRQDSDIPIISFTRGGGELDRVLGLQAGADDCLDEPYRIEQVLARIESVMRRARPTVLARSAILTIGPLRIDVASREVRLDGRLIELTRKEFDLLLHLVRGSDTVISRQHLMTEIWHHPRAQTVSSRASRTVDTHVSSLRAKLGDRQWILTVRGIGFRLGTG
jgi:DNA-binding response OmpR family regulator